MSFKTVRAGGIIVIIFLCFLAVFSCENQWMRDVKNHKIVTFNTNGGLPVPANQELFGDDIVFRPFDPLLPGHNFAGWYIDNFTFLIPWNFFAPPKGHMTLHAKWDSISPSLKNKIPFAAVTVTAPVAGDIPNADASGDGNFDISAVTWTPGDNLFKKSTSYTAAVTLTAVGEYTFTAGFSATINGNRAEAERVSDTCVILSYTFPETEPRAVTHITVKEQPVNLTYTHGEPLDLTGLEIWINYDEGAPESVSFNNFGSRGITANPAHSEALNRTLHNGQPVTVRLGSFPPVDTNNLTVNPAPILTAAVSVTQPVTGQAPSSSASVTSGSCTTGPASWQPTDNPFRGSTPYTVTVTLTADGNHEFPQGFTAVINNQPATVTNNAGSAVTLSYQFGATTAKAVTGLTVNKQPATTTYTHGDTLNLTGLEVTIEYNDDTTETVTFSALTGFGSSGITASPPNGTILNRGSHNGQPVRLTLGDFSANTVNLIVNLFEIAGADINITSPVTGAQVNPTATDANSTGLFTVSGVTWNPSGHTKFRGGTQYAASVTLTAAANHKFANPFTATYNGTFSAAVTSNTGSAVTLSYQFAVTAPKTVTGISVTAQPNLTYTYGQTLNLSGLAVTIEYDDDTTETVTFNASTGFGSSGITASPAHGDALNISHNGQRVTLTLGSFTATTNQLTVGKAAGAGVTLNVTGNPLTLGISASAALTQNNGQSVEYVISASPTAPNSGWTAYTGNITHTLIENATNYIYARSAAHANYNEGTPVRRTVAFYTVTYHANSGGAVTENIPSKETYFYNDAYPAPTNTAPTPAPTREGFNFSGWFTEPACATQWGFGTSAVTSAVNLYAKWIQISGNDGINISIESIIMHDPSVNSIDFTIYKDSQNGNRATQKVITITDPSGNYSNPRWKIRGAGAYSDEFLNGNSNSFTVDANNYFYGTAGGHVLILIVDIGGIDYQLNINFTVAN